jgi:phage terminase large subunit-like protein
MSSLTGSRTLLLDSNQQIQDALLKLREYSSRLQEDRLRNYKIVNQDLKDYHMTPAKIKAIIGGNRSSKTTTNIVDMALELVGDHPLQKTGLIPKPPVHWRAVCVDFVNGIEKIIKPMLRYWIPRGCLKSASFEKSYAEKMRVLTLANGSQVELMSYDQDMDAFAGTSRNGVLFDEEPPEPIFDECMARLVDCNGRCLIGMTPLKGQTFIYHRIFRESQKDDSIRVWFANIEHNAALDQVSVQKFLSKLSERDRKVRGKGEFIQQTGLVYPEFDYSRHVCAPFHIPDGANQEKYGPAWPRYVTYDWGILNPMCLLWWAVSPDGVHYCYREHYQAGLDTEQQAKIYLDRMTKGEEDLVKAIIPDPAVWHVESDGRSLGEKLRRAGMRKLLPREHLKGINDVSAGVSEVKAWLRHDPPRMMLFKDAAPNLEEQFEMHSWKDVSDNSMGRDMPAKGHDHAIVQLRYLALFRPAGMGKREHQPDPYQIKRKKIVINPPKETPVAA